MDINTIIAKKRLAGTKGELDKDEIKYFIGKWVKGEIKDSQAAALMSYIYTNGLTEDEIIRFVVEVGNSGDVLDLKEICDNIIDKHSTGGVGDKVTLILLPIIAALGLPVAKISSRGLGISGGTIDKLVSIPGFNPNISLEEFKENVQNIGISIVGQDLNLAPAESKLYKLRNEISCRDSIVLIAISLMSLKIATGSNKIVFDLSCGKGTYLDTREDAKRLGKLLVRIGKALNKDVGYIITLMDEPVGNSVGNILVEVYSPVTEVIKHLEKFEYLGIQETTDVYFYDPLRDNLKPHNLEIKETIKALNGNMTKDVEDTVISLASIVLNMAYGEKDFATNAARIVSVIKSGQAMTKFKQMVSAQRSEILNI